MIKTLVNRAKRTAGSVVFHVAPVWHLTNLRREAYDQIEDLHYQVGYCRATRMQVEERLGEIELEAAQSHLSAEEKLMLDNERRQLESRLVETRELEAKALEVVQTYKESLPKLVSQLDHAIQMTRLNRSQQKVVKVLGNSKTNDGSEIRQHITNVRASAYALTEQLNGHLALGQMRHKRLAITNG